jgi:1-acyl-sn-glycerol-3-phosphate acyltransferase
MAENRIPKKSWIGHFVYDASCVLSRILFTVFWRLEIRGVNHIPKHGPVIIAGNHKSYADPPLLGSSVPREVHTLGKKELFSFRPFGWVIRQMNAHPLNRSSGIEALKLSQELLSCGFALMVFPEGKRIKSDSLGPPKPGIGLLSMKTGAPIIPTYIHNNGHLLKGRKLTITFGAPIHPLPHHTYQWLAEEVMREIQKLKDQIEGA